jgi:shikimate dehydrogenase
MAGPQAVTGATRVAAVIGDPVVYSRSPAIHNAAFTAAGLDWVYVAFATARGNADRALEAMASLGLGGLSVTMPHKEQVAQCLEHLSPAARRLGAVNCVAWDGDRLMGHNTDATGFVAAVSHAGHSLDGATVAVLGAGGAGRAVVAGVLDAGARRVLVVNRHAGRAAHLIGLDPERCVAAGSADVAAADIAAADVVVNATPVGMVGTPGCIVPDGVLHGGQVVADLVYAPVDTELLMAARAVGASTVDGLGMLVHQAADAFRLWTGVEPPLDVMLAAVDQPPS